MTNAAMEVWNDVISNVGLLAGFIGVNWAAGQLNTMLRPTIPDDRVRTAIISGVNDMAKMSSFRLFSALPTLTNQ